MPCLVVDGLDLEAWRYLFFYPTYLTIISNNCSI